MALASDRQTISEIVRHNPFNKEYVVRSCVGSGNYGRVFHLEKKNGPSYAAKVTELQKEGDNKVLSITTLREIVLLKKMNHVNVMRLVDVKRSPSGHIWMLSDFANKDLMSYILCRKKNPMDLQTIRNFTYQIICGLAYIHSQGAFHRDIKPANILMYEDRSHPHNYVLKISDFGLARDLCRPIRPTSPEVVTSYYRPPEVFLGQKYLRSTLDVWSVAITFIHMVNNEVPFAGVTSEEEILYRIFQMVGTPGQTDFAYADPNLLATYTRGLPAAPPVMPIEKVLKRPIGNDGMDVLRKMMILNPFKRILARTARMHPYFHEDRIKQAAYEATCIRGQI